VDLVNTLELEKNAGKTGRLAQSLLNVDLVILDELGYLPFSQVGGALLFHLLSKLYEPPFLTVWFAVRGWRIRAARRCHRRLMVISRAFLCAIAGL
jgi:DNA replication protein DnaC